MNLHVFSCVARFDTMRWVDGDTLDMCFCGSNTSHRNCNARSRSIITSKRPERVDSSYCGSYRTALMLSSCGSWSE